MIGLPPKPEAIDAFAADPDPDAYHELVDQLLASPHYGERWGRYWLDIVHCADTHGYDKDKMRPNAWPYRDYVIRSLNEDKPYARFVREQLAGDLLFPGSPDGIVALGFVAAGPFDCESLRRAISLTTLSTVMKCSRWISLLQVGTNTIPQRSMQPPAVPAGRNCSRCA